MPQRPWNEHTGTLTNQVFRLPSNPSRRAVIISNNSQTLDMVYRVGTDDASANAGIRLEAESAIALDGDLCPEGDVTLFCAGDGNSPAAGGAYTVYEVVG